MVINYKRLNDNIRDDSYNIPNKSFLLNKIQGKKWFSKFDCKSGFYQIKMYPDHVHWTSFTTPEGLFEWLVMPFGLKTAPCIFQRKMDDIFRQYNDFILVYIDDILICSQTEQEHVAHLDLAFKLFKKHGLIISKKKVELFRKNVKFLGMEIGNGEIKLQDHIATKILEFPDKLEGLKQIQSFLGLVNQARIYIKDLGKLLGPLYNKTRKNGQRHFNIEDIKLVQKIKYLVKNLPKLYLPLDSDYLIVETDGCKEGWGAVLYCKPNKYSNKNTERLCRYSSGSFKERGYLTSLDYELLAVIYALEEFKALLLCKEEFCIRTDCEAIVRYNKNKDSRYTNRWVKFLSTLSNFKVGHIEWQHIKGQDNKLADMLSRRLIDTS